MPYESRSNMDSQTKRMLAASALCMLVLFGWIKLQSIYNPPQPVESTTEVTSGGAVSPEPGTEGGTPASAPAATYAAVGGGNTRPIELGSDKQNGKYKFAVAVSPIGASVRTLNLADARSHVAKNRKHPDHAPYELLRPVSGTSGTKEFHSFTTESVQIVERIAGKRVVKEVPLADLIWKIEPGASESSVTLSADVKQGEMPTLEIEKTYTVKDDRSPFLDIAYSVRNVTSRPLQVHIIESGPTGFRKEDQRFDHARAMAAVIDADGRIKAGDTAIRTDVQELARSFTPGEGLKTRWSAVSNKYFTCIVAPVPNEKSNAPEYLEEVKARTHLNVSTDESDLTIVQRYAVARAISPDADAQIPPQATAAFSVKVYCGPKSESRFEQMVMAKELNFALTMAHDRSFCTFDFITAAMQWLLELIYKLVGNYGVAIIFLVVVVRAILHPISKKGQINMMRMQKNMSRIKPKIEAIQEQYKNDRQMLSQETMKLYREEGINPAGQMLGCLPMFLQMPIWVALYTTLNTSFELRHAPFLGYIRDLSAPDALVPFGGEYHIPLISTLMGGAIASFNLLPIIMTALMYGQQKLTQKLTKPDKPPAPKLDKDGRPLPDTMAQQQKIMNFMMIFMGFIFYNMPSGLCLYILCSSMLGMAEQWYIRKHVKEKEARGDFDVTAASTSGGPKKPRGGWLYKKFEEMQKIAEQQRLAQAKGQAPAPKRKKNRF